MRGDAAMGKVTCDISVSHGGLVTGPNVRVGNGMGDGGDRLHDWRFAAKTESDLAIVDEIHASTGAVLTGKSAIRGSRPSGNRTAEDKFDRLTGRHPLPIRSGEVTASGFAFTQPEPA